MRKIDSIEIHKCSIARLIPMQVACRYTNTQLTHTFMMSHSVEVSNGGQWEDKSSSNHIKLLYYFSFNPLTYYLLVYLLHFLHWAHINYTMPSVSVLNIYGHEDIPFWRVAHTMEQAASNSPIMHCYIQMSRTISTLQAADCLYLITMSFVLSCI